MKLKGSLFTKCISIFSVLVLLLGIAVTAFSMLNSSTAYAQTVTDKYKMNMNRYNHEKMTVNDKEIISKVDDNSGLEKQANLLGTTKESIKLVNTAKVKDTKNSDSYYVKQYAVDTNKNDSITLVYNSAGKLLSTETIMFSENDKMLEKYTDGVLTLKGEKDDNGNFISMYNVVNGKKQYYSNNDLKSISKWYNCMNSTLSGLGVPSWVIGVVGVGCAAVCALTVGTGCWACLGVAGVGYGSEIVYALNHCRSKW